MKWNLIIFRRPFLKMKDELLNKMEKYNGRQTRIHSERKEERKAEGKTV